VFESADRTSVASIVEMKSVEDCQRLEQLPEVRETLDHSNATLNLVVRLYHQVEAFGS
jgi:hypothetical protein